MLAQPSNKAPLGRTVTAEEVGNVAAFIFVINLFDLNGSDNLVKKGYNVENLIEFPGH